MIDIKTVRKLAHALPEAEEHDHWGRPSFRVRKKIFATLWPVEKLAVLKFTPLDQSVFCSYPGNVFYPVPGGWGKQGSTFVELKKVRKKMFLDALTLSYKTAAPKTLLKKYFNEA